MYWKCSNSDCNNIWEDTKYLSLSRSCPKCGTKFPFRHDPIDEKEKKEAKK